MLGMAMIANLQNGSTRRRARALRSGFCKAAEDDHKRQHAADSLAQKRRPRHTCNAHVERRDEEDIDRDVGC